MRGHFPSLDPNVAPSLSPPRPQAVSMRLHVVYLLPQVVQLDGLAVEAKEKVGGVAPHGHVRHLRKLRAGAPVAGRHHEHLSAQSRVSHRNGSLLLRTHTFLLLSCTSPQIRSPLCPCPQVLAANMHGADAEGLRLIRRKYFPNGELDDGGGAIPPLAAGACAHRGGCGDRLWKQRSWAAGAGRWRGGAPYRHWRQVCPLGDYSTGPQCQQGTAWQSGSWTTERAPFRAWRQLCVLGRA